MEEWYIQDHLSNPKRPMGTAINPVIDQMNRPGQTVTSLDQDWDMEAAADDNEAYSIEEDQL
jgi:hypothetical protein